MKSKIIPRALAAMTALLAASALQLPAAEPAPVIRIDGKLDETIWKKARPLEEFKTIEYKILRGVVPAGQKPQAQTTGLVMNDSHYLYLGFVAQEPMMESLEVTPFPRDGSIWTNDSIEIYVAPFEREDEYYQVIIDTTGQVFDGFKRDGKLDASYDLSVSAKTQKREDGWTMEIAIPLSELGLSNAREALMNFGRERKPVNEFTSWHGDFGKPETWKKLPLSLDQRYSIDVRDWNHGDVLYGKNSFSLEFVPATTAPVNVVMELQEKGNWKAKSRKKLKSTPGKLTKVSFPYELLPHERPQSLRYRVESKGKTIFQSAYKFNLASDALMISLNVSPYYFEERAGFLNLSSVLSDESLETGRIRLTVKDPAGKTQKVEEIQPLQKTMQVAFDISSWREGTGEIVAELITGKRVIAQRELAVVKRSGPFSEPVR